MLEARFVKDYKVYRPGRDPETEEEIEAVGGTGLSIRPRCNMSSDRHGFMCTRPPHEDDLHIACAMGKVYATWRG